MNKLLQYISLSEILDVPEIIINIKSEFAKKFSMSDVTLQTNLLIIQFLKALF